jgi:hypothetical protein
MRASETHFTASASIGIRSASPHFSKGVGASGSWI